MKPAKLPAPEGAASRGRRAQPFRHTRANPPRTLSLRQTSLTSEAGMREQYNDLVPAVTHFADAITALPKELVRHFTLLKEVDAKICDPKDELFDLIRETLNNPHSLGPLLPADGDFGLANPGISVRAPRNSSGLSLIEPQEAVIAPKQSTGDVTSLDPNDYGRWQRFREMAVKIQERLISLEEKNHVISTANDALEKQLARIEQLWPHLELEFSEEAKWGSTTHWAYVENRVTKVNSAQAERSRREGAATLSAAAQQLAEEAAARSSDRKKATNDKKGSKTHLVDVDADIKAQEPGKKPLGGAKTRKSMTEMVATLGLGISTVGSIQGTLASKRRKMETRGINGAPMERALSSAFSAGSSKQKTASPRETPVPETASKKRKALPTSSNTIKKNRLGPTASPFLASSPVSATFAGTYTPSRTSPPPPSSSRPALSRARQNSFQLCLETVRPQTSQDTIGLMHDVSLEITDAAASSSADRIAVDPEPLKDAAAAVKPEEPEEEPGPQLQTTPLTGSYHGKREHLTKVGENRDLKRELATLISTPVTSLAAVTTKSGRASKPSTPAIATFVEAATVRSRPSRNLDGAGNGVKRSHKKGGSVSAAAAVTLAAQQAAAAAEVRRGVPDTEDDGDADVDEPRYCYCNGVSYGEMVACDDKDCPREWFHLGCVGLKVAPKGNAKWYCEDCKKRPRVIDKRINR